MILSQYPIGSGFFENTTAEEVISGIELNGKTVIVTGGHSGIGLETTRILSKAGAFVIVGARDINKAAHALSTLKNIKILELDLSEPSSVDVFCKKFTEGHRDCHLLINNAGIMATPLLRNSLGHEIQFATNHLGHFQLTAGLWKTLVNAKARVINLSSLGHRFSKVRFEDPDFLNSPYDKWISYGQSKTANALFSVALNKIGEPFGIVSLAVHPGRITTTELNRFMSKDELASITTASPSIPTYVPSFIKNIPQGAATTIWCATSPVFEKDGGVYCADCDISPIVPDDSTQTNGVRKWAVDPEAAEQLWNLSERLLGLRWPAGA